MSRSYRHNPIVKDGGRSKKLVKRQASKKVRRCDELSDGMRYKNVFCRWNICDNWSRYTLTEALTWETRNVHFSRYKYYKVKSVKELTYDWKKHYYWK